MSTVKALLYTSKTLKNGEHPIMLRITKERKTKYFSLGISCKKELWDEENNLPKKKHPLFKEYLIRIDKKKLEMNKLLLGYENENENYSMNLVKSELQKSKIKVISVFDYFEEIILRLKNTGQIKNSDVYKDTKRMLKNYLGENKSVNFSDITVSFLIHFEEDLMKQKLKPNTVFLYLRTLRALFNKAIKEDRCKKEIYPFIEFSLSKYNKIRTPKRAVSKDDIRKIEMMTVEPGTSIFFAKNIFMFSYYNRGINFIDIAFLKWSDIRNQRLIYTRRKTGETFSIGLMQPVKEILNYYFENNVGNNYIFPILNMRHKTPISISNRMKKVLRQVNKDLKEIARKCVINDDLTTYVARHSFATILKKEGISTSIISEALGHDSEKTTQIYLDSFENTVLDDASKALL